MADINFKNNPIQTIGNLPAVGTKAPSFSLTDKDLQEKGLEDFKGKNIVLNIFPSVDTGTCAMSVRKFNEKLASVDNTVVLCISKDLPFAQSRFCAAENIENVYMLSEYKNFDFSNDYEVLMSSGPLAGLMSRAVVVLNPDQEVIYTEQVSEIVDEPNYTEALDVLK